MNKIILTILLTFILLSCVSQSKSEKSNKKNDEPQFKKEADVFILKKNGDKIHFDAQLADTEEKSAIGLMYRTHMEDQQSMLFIFDYERPLSFWMKNTYISLDIIFINQNKKIVSIAKNTEPLSETMIPSNMPALYALEVKAGICDQLNIEVGDTVKYEILN